MSLSFDRHAFTWFPRTLSWNFHRQVAGTHDYENALLGARVNLLQGEWTRRKIKYAHTLFSYPSTVRIDARYHRHIRLLNLENQAGPS